MIKDEMEAVQKKKKIFKTSKHIIYLCHSLKVRPIINIIMCNSYCVLSNATGGKYSHDVISLNRG